MLKEKKNSITIGTFRPEVAVNRHGFKSLILLASAFAIGGLLGAEAGRAQASGSAAKRVDRKEKKTERKQTAATPNDKPAGEKNETVAVSSVGDMTNGVPTPADYRVGLEDELMISVWHEPELSQAVVVRPDGMITLPLLNDLKVVGLTTEEMQALLTEKMKTLVNDPQVTVILKAVHSRKVFLVGNVAKQGVYPLGGRKTVLELLAEAGGLGPFAKTRSIYVLRKENGKEVRLSFNYKKALSGKGNNPELMPGDMVVVP